LARKEHQFKKQVFQHLHDEKVLHSSNSIPDWHLYGLWNQSDQKQKAKRHGFTRRWSKLSSWQDAFLP
jgi:hypothetical protein